MLKKNLILEESDIPKNWQDCLLPLWEEDDAPVPDKERLSDAFIRIAGRFVRGPVKVIDDGDAIFSFYPSGWVKVLSCDGGMVCVLVAQNRQCQ